MREKEYPAHSQYGAVPYNDDFLEEKRFRKNKPWFTLFMIALNTGVFLYTMYVNGWKFEAFQLNPMIGPSLQTLFDCGAKDTSRVQDGEYWRLITACFLHAGIVHLVMNMAALLALGVPLEMDFGTSKFAMIYLISGLASTTFSCLFLPDRISVGASGAIFGIFGSNWSILLQNWGDIHGRCWHLCVLIVLTVLNLGLGLLPFVDNYAHIGGLLCGFCLGMMLVFDDRNHGFVVSCRQHTCLAVGIATTALTLTIGLLVLLSGHDLTNWCSWCSELNCVEFDWAPWSCDDDMISCGYSLYEDTGEVIFTCGDGSQHDFCCVNVELDDSEMKDELSTICKNICV